MVIAFSSLRANIKDLPDWLSSPARPVASVYVWSWAVGSGLCSSAGVISPGTLALSQLMAWVDDICSAMLRRIREDLICIHRKKKEER